MAELPISEFLRARLLEFDPDFEVREGTAFSDLFFKPMQFITQPFRDEADELFIGQSLRRILKLADPDAFNEELVDDLVANVYVYRVEGGKSSGVARVYYDSPKNREYPAGGATIVGANGKNYVNPAPFIVTEAQMSAQIEGGTYYFDIPVTSQDTGADTEILTAGGLVSVVGDDEVISVTNKLPIQGGTSREKNTDLINRAAQSIATRDLVVGKGFSATLFQNFPGIVTEVQSIGLGDDEMMRDILFNTHVGGKHDGYIKTPRVQTGVKDFTTLLIDETRASRTTTRFAVPGVGPIPMGEANITRVSGDPVVREAKTVTRALFTTPSIVGTLDLRFNQYVRISIDDKVRDIRVAGADPQNTKSSEIVKRINDAFGFIVAFNIGNNIRIVSLSAGRLSRVRIEPAPAFLSSSAVIPVFGDPGSPPDHWEVFGDGPFVFSEGVHYTINDGDGLLTRIPSALLFTGTAQINLTVGSTTVTAPTPGTFDPASAVADNILKVVTGAAAGEYRITSYIDSQTITIDKGPIATGTSASGGWNIRDTAIKDSEVVEAEYFFNPVSIDIGKFIALDADGKVRGIRPGREEQTITDVAFLRIVQIETIDSVSGEPLGQILEGNGGFGLGPYGLGPYGIGSGSDYRLVVNVPTARFSAFEDSYIVINSGFQGFSLRVTYEYVPEIESVSAFCRSDSERVMDGDIYIKHFIPAYVSGTIEYEVDATDISIPDNDALTLLVNDYVNTRKAGTALQISDVAQFILKQIDPTGRFTGSVRPFKLNAVIHNTDGSTSSVESAIELVVPKQNPFPKFTTRPLSPRISHWLADNIILVRL